MPVEEPSTAFDAEDKVLIRRQMKRRYVLAFFEKLPPCLVVPVGN